MEDKSKSEQRQTVLQLRKARVKEISEVLQLFTKPSSVTRGIETSGGIKLPQITINEDKVINEHCVTSKSVTVKEETDKETRILDDEHNPEKKKHQPKESLSTDMYQDDSYNAAVDSGVTLKETSDYKSEEDTVILVDRKINEEFESKTSPKGELRPSREYFLTFENQEEDNEAVADTCFDFSEPQSKTSINNIIQEMISLEKRHLRGLQILVEKFATEDNVQNIFAENIKAMYEHIDKFVASLIENCEDADRIAHVFINEEATFKNVYPIYAKNFACSKMTHSDHYNKDILENIEKINSNLRDILSRPIRRLADHLQFLTRIKKELNKSSCSTENIEFAYSIVKEVNKQSDDILHIMSVDNIDLSTKGSFIMSQKFWISKQNRFRGMVFLFEDEIIITQISPQNIDRFNYIDRLKLTDLGIEKFDNADNKFHLRDYSKRSDVYVLEADDGTIKSKWTTKLQDILYMQAEQMKLSSRHTKTYTNTENFKIQPDANKRDLEKSKFYI